MNFILLKQLHIGLAAVTIAGFILRWAWRMMNLSLSRHRWIRALPHVIDTLLLLTGILLAFSIGQSPWSAAWLGAKIGGLVAYIALGMAAMKLDSPTWRTVTFVLAILTFGWMVSVARLKSPAGFLQGIA